ncbi:hypothetical protein KFK09_028468 [Dendrobium nobile]|uniref:Uncharacterized protein n=1 Tax=Dendrobium nobile TaxID=94219 RepID=A0A8T3A3E5_DENNO|nr:hypothetical protein KFK09_028468 [Dendrobium nobile]
MKLPSSQGNSKLSKEETKASSKLEERKPGHVRADCPTLQDHSSKEKEKGEEKAKSRKDKRKIQRGFWAESGTDSSETEPKEETTNLCFMGEDQSDEESSLWLVGNVSDKLLGVLRAQELTLISEFLREFFANLCINPTFTALISYVNRRPVEITYQDCVDLLQLSTTGDKLHLIASDPDLDWSTANHFLRQTNVPYHVGETSSLVKDARIIQHVLRTSVIPKVGDRIHITPILSLTTFYIMAHREFNTADLIFRYIDHLTTIRDPGHKRKPNLALGHIIAYVLETKYQLQYPIPPNLPTPFYSNNSFSTLHSTRLHPEEP